MGPFACKKNPKQNMKKNERIPMYLCNKSKQRSPIMEHKKKIKNSFDFQRKKRKKSRLKEFSRTPKSCELHYCIFIPLSLSHFNPLFLYFLLATKGHARSPPHTSAEKRRRRRKKKVVLLARRNTCLWLGPRVSFRLRQAFAYQASGVNYPC